MNRREAMKAMAEGKKVLSTNSEVYFFNELGFLYISERGGMGAVFKSGDGLIEKNTYEIYKEPRTLEQAEKLIEIAVEILKRNYSKLQAGHKAYPIEPGSTIHDWIKKFFKELEK